MSFEEYLISKKIDAILFQREEPQRWEDWRKEFEQVNPSSFSARKLYLINSIRRKYKFKAATIPTVSTGDSSVAVKPKPVFKPRPKIN